MAWLSTWLQLGRGDVLLDIGGGVGGPVAWAAAEHGVHPVLAEPMFGAVEGARRLFGIEATVALGEQLPLASSSFSAAWALGVLSTTPHKAGLLAELRRVLAPGGRAGLVAYVAEGPFDDAPQGNEFPTMRELLALLTDARLSVVEMVRVSDLPETPSEWQRREDDVAADLASRHGDDERWQRAQADEKKVAELISEGRVVAHAIRLSLVG